MRTILLSGGFDPIHSGHIKMIKSASDLGFSVVVAVNSDEWLMSKKGFVFHSVDERCDIINSLRWVDRVITFNDSDGTAIDAIKKTSPTAFGNGGDRVPGNTPEDIYCYENNIISIYDLGLDSKSNSSSVIATKHTMDRPWGKWEVLAYGPGYKVKRLSVNPNASLSMQRHQHRAEHWYIVRGEGNLQLEAFTLPLNKGDKVVIKPWQWHRLSSLGNGIEVIEIQKGDILLESDIERIGV